MRRLLYILLFAACSTGSPLVVVTVSSPSVDLTGLARLHATATAAGHTSEFDVSFSDGSAFDIPPARTFGVEIPEGYAGDFAITVGAVDGNGATVSSGGGSTTTSVGHRSDIAVLLGENDDMGGDGGGMTCAAANYGCGKLGPTDCGPCILTSVHPPIAKAGDTVVLEGAFNPMVGVSFPGVAMAAMPTLLGPNRATVVVPPGTTAGGVALQLGAMQAPLKQPFRRVTFDLVLHDFHQTYQQTDAARPMGQPTTVGHTVGAVVLAGNAAEVLGGEGGSPSPVPVSTVEAGTANADGTLGILAADNTRSLLAPRAGFAVYQAGGSVYVIGGYDDMHQALATVERAPIRADGTGTDKFAATTISLMTPRFFPATAVIGRYLYVFGGGNGKFGAPGAQILKTVERAPIGEDGSLGAFEPGMSPLSIQRAGAVAVVLRDRVYLIGGIDSTAAVQDGIDSAPINGDGTLGAFATMGPTLKAPRAFPGVVQLGARVYVLGGLGPGAPLTSIESAAIDGTGALNNFSVESIALQMPRVGQPLLHGNYLHYLDNAPAERGGIGGSAIGPFSDTGLALAMPRSQMAVAVVGPDVYLFGGMTGVGPTANISHARVDPDGTLGAFSDMAGGTPLPDLPVAGANSATAVFERDIWICNGGCLPFTVKADGSLMPLAPVSSGAVGRTGYQLVVVGNGLYAVGGDSGGWDSVQSIALDATRRPTGSWGTNATMQFPVKANGRYAYLGDNVDYVFGGDVAGVPMVTATGIPGNFMAGPLVQGPLRSNTMLFGLGSAVAVAGGTDQATGNAVDSVWAALQGGDFVDTTRHLVHARRGHVALALGNYLYVIGGSDAGGVLGSIEQAPLQ
jgi:Kelch motif